LQFALTSYWPGVTRGSRMLVCSAQLLKGMWLPYLEGVLTVRRGQSLAY